MIRLNRVSEYALIALKHLAEKSPLSSSAKDISELYHLPLEMTAKTLQKMKEHHLVSSSLGVRGGYVLRRPLNQLSLRDVLHALEAFEAIVPCEELGAPVCEYAKGCNLKPFVSELNRRVFDFLGQLSLESLLSDHSLFSQACSSSPTISFIPSQEVFP